MLFAVQAARELCESLAVGSISLRHIQCENERYKIATEVNKVLPCTINDIPTPKSMPETAHNISSRVYRLSNGTLHAERVRREHAIWIRPCPYLLQPLILRLVFIVSQSHLMQVPITIRSPQHSLVLLAVAAVRPNEQLIVLSLPCIRNLLVLRLVEAINNLADSRIAPAVGSAVRRVGVEQ